MSVEPIARRGTQQPLTDQTKVGGFKWATFKTFAMKEDFE